MNIAEILKDCPRGTRLYSPIYGELSLVSVKTGMLYPIFCRIKRNGNTVSYTEDGKSYTKDAEPTLFSSKGQRDWSKFGVSDQKQEPELKPFDKVLVRDGDDDEWVCDFFSHIDERDLFYCVGTWFKQCIPYEGNEHLLGTTKKQQ